jgi:hypothetical protein
MRVSSGVQQHILQQGRECLRLIRRVGRVTAGKIDEGYVQRAGGVAQVPAMPGAAAGERPAAG